MRMELLLTSGFSFAFFLFAFLFSGMMGFPLTRLSNSVRTP